MQSFYMLPPPLPGVPVVCMLRFNIVTAQEIASYREEKYKRYKCGDSNSQELPTTKGLQHQGPNSQRNPTLPQNPPVSLISPLPRHRNIQPHPLASIHQQGASHIMTSNIPAPSSQHSASIPQKIASPLLPSDLPDPLPQPSPSINQKCTPPLLPSNVINIRWCYKWKTMLR